MFTNPPIRKAIEDGEDAHITDLIAVGREVGMQTWTDSFVNVVHKDLVEKRVAVQFAPNRDALEMALKGIDIAHRAIG